MDKSYELVSGEEINLEDFSAHEIEHLNSLEETINLCQQHGRKDYFYVYRLFEDYTKRIYGSITTGVINTPFYQVARDLVERYRRKCLPKATKEWFDMKSKK